MSERPVTDRPPSFGRWGRVLVPAGPGYLGTLDAAVLFGARAVGASGGVALSYLLVLRFVLLVPVTVAGLGLLLVRYGGRRGGRTAAGRGGP